MTQGSEEHQQPPGDDHPGAAGQDGAGGPSPGGGEEGGGESQQRQPGLDGDVQQQPRERHGGPHQAGPGQSVLCPRVGDPGAGDTTAGQWRGHGQLRLQCPAPPRQQQQS